jgi:hypothetical protein
LRLFVSAAKYSMQPGFHCFCRQAILGAYAASYDLHVFIDKNLGRKIGANASFDREPLICEISNRSVEPNEAGTDLRGWKRCQVKAARPSSSDSRLVRHRGILAWEPAKQDRHSPVAKPEL